MNTFNAFICKLENIILWDCGQTVSLEVTFVLLASDFAQQVSSKAHYVRFYA